MALSVVVTQIGSGVITEDTGVRLGSSDRPTTFLLRRTGSPNFRTNCSQKINHVTMLSPTEAIQVSLGCGSVTLRS